MKLNNALAIGSKGGHGPIKYYVTEYEKGKSVKFNFTEPKGFKGYHQFEIQSLSTDETMVKHTIKMNTTMLGYLKWILAIKWLHDALIEDAFDGIENRILNSYQETPWNWYVRFLRKMMG